MSRTICKKAFTLIELLVVVAIISLLSSVVIVSLQDSREKAAIAKLKEQTRQIQTALELYRSDHGEYPDIAETGEDNMPALFTNLDSYIEYTELDTNQIRSFTAESIIYFNTASNPDVSCEDQSNTPYIIYTIINLANQDDEIPFKPVTVGGEIWQGFYCLNTPI